MNRIRRFLKETPFARYVMVTLFVGLVGYHFSVWAHAKVKAYVQERVLPQAKARAQAYFEDRVIPLVVKEVKVQVEQEIKEKLTGFLPGSPFGSGSQLDSGTLTRKPDAVPDAGIDIRRPTQQSPGFGLPGILPRLQR